MQSKHDVDLMKIVDDVWTFMTLTYLYHCSEKKVRLKLSKSLYAFLEV